MPSACCAAAHGQVAGQQFVRVAEHTDRQVAGGPRADARQRGELGAQRGGVAPGVEHE